MVPKRVLPLLLLFGLLFPLTVRADDVKTVRLDVTVKDADESLDTEWFGIYTEGIKVGYTSVSRTKGTEDGKPVYFEKSVFALKLKSFGQKTEITTNETLVFDSAPPFRLLRGETVRNDGKIVEKITLVAAEKGYDATIVVAGVERKKHLDKFDYTMADSLSSEVWLKRHPKKGDKITTKSLDLDELKIEASTATLISEKATVVNGVKAKLFEVNSLNHKTGVESRASYDDKAHLLELSVAIFEMRRETEEAAKNTEFSTDLFMRGMAKVDKGIGDGPKVTALVLELTTDEAKLLPDGPRQTLTNIGKNVYQLKTGKKYGKVEKVSEADVKEALEETLAYPIKDAKVLDLAKKAIGDAKTDKEKVDKLVKFVYDFVKPSLAASVPRMHDLMERKEGDCKSYALMFTCLARAVGLPSREVSGFIYIGDAVMGFGGHAWNEVLLDGYWVPVDAGWNQTEIDATHLCLGTDKQSSANLLKSFGKLSFKLIEVEGGK